jgi:hypothetical protein
MGALAYAAAQWESNQKKELPGCQYLGLPNY